MWFVRISFFFFPFDKKLNIRNVEGQQLSTRKFLAADHPILLIYNVKKGMILVSKDIS
jgi:hypothetical protein